MIYCNFLNVNFESKRNLRSKYFSETSVHIIQIAHNGLKL